VVDEFRIGPDAGETLLDDERLAADAVAATGLGLVDQPELGRGDDGIDERAEGLARVERALPIGPLAVVWRAEEQEPERRVYRTS
jgi:hypothetical protein